MAEKLFLKLTPILALVLFFSLHAQADEIENGIFSIHTGEGKNTFQGTGFLISVKDQFFGITAKHVLMTKVGEPQKTMIEAPYKPDGPNFYIRFGGVQGNSKYQIQNEVKCPWKDIDICYFQIGKVDLRAIYRDSLPLAWSCQMSVGDKINIFGFDNQANSLFGPLSNTIYSTEGSFDFNGIEHRNLIRTQARTNGGLSGSPVFNSDMQVIGLHNGQIGHSQVFTPLSLINGRNLTNVIQFNCANSDSFPRENDPTNLVKKLQIKLKQHNCRALDDDGAYDEETLLALKLYNLTGAKQGCEKLVESRALDDLQKNINHLQKCPRPACGNVQQGLKGDGWAKELNQGCEYYEVGKYPTEYATWEGECNTSGKIDGYGKLDFIYLSSTDFRSKTNTIDFYEGNVADGYREGKGTTYFTSSAPVSSKQGTYKQNNLVSGLTEYRNGNGSFKFDSNYRFEAKLSEFNQGKPNGKGILYKNSEVLYVGNVDNNQLSGLGVRFTPNKRGSVATVGIFDSRFDQIALQDNGRAYIDMDGEYQFNYLSRQSFPRYEYWVSRIEAHGAPLWYHCPNTDRSSCRSMSSNDVPEEFLHQSEQFLQFYQSNMTRFK